MGWKKDPGPIRHGISFFEDLDPGVPIHRAVGSLRRLTLELLGQRLGLGRAPTHGEFLHTLSELRRVCAQPVGLLAAVIVVRPR